MGLTVWRSAFPHVPQVINMEVQMLVFVFSLVVAIYCHVGCIYHTIKDVSHTINDVSINFGDIVADPIGVAARLVGGVVFTQPNGQRTLPVYPGHIPERSPLAIVVISIDIVGESRSKLVIG
ncbi:MAG: hypothetical protein P5702_17315 [Limnospira sp. PMC 1291.21]|uniref:hypothetical protein n=2 Tax=Limnospira TaxID=2596745 RepID=UPI001E3C2506|nr:MULTISPECIES: hypothetical protein [unclassified Limnospira]MDT9194520.1 hypothetical protein [Limnospira sp. PMC 1245.20]MDT9204869.1 hypothetical protein [Limnospira sp. PMC 1243.20]MDT9215077.1 hypothetical protein [Limnospira sp. PMC 1256.20]MDT9220288.1 hypothetical protein [Limnospira sp. PMC 1240.20]MDT9260954.1 hypothetical protein [Limnospira sp. PMC 1236.20]MDT9266117.1 hypothetical protein [Limnospira sp. PMC 1223.20]MDT9271150.1 hypothetical protein [Limnospira sp. PMC 1234.20